MATSDRRLPEDRRAAAEDRPELHDDGDRGLRPRVPLHQGAATTRASWARSSSCRPATSRTWTAGRTTGPACRRCGTPRTASARSAALTGADGGVRLLLRLRHHPQGADRATTARPFAVETAHIKFQDSDLSARIYRSLFDVARQYRESIDVYGSKEVRRVAADRARAARAAHAPSCPSRRSPSRCKCPDYRPAAAEGHPARSRPQGVYDLAKKTHLSFTQGAGHGGSPSAPGARVRYRRWSRTATRSPTPGSPPTGPASASAPTSRR